MTKPQLFDLVELIVDIPQSELPEPEIPGAELRIGDRGNIVEVLGDHEAYIVEFLDDEGYTYHWPMLEPYTFVVVWQDATREYVPLAEQIADLAARLPESAAQSIADFARFQYARTVPFRSAEWTEASSAAVQQNQPERELIAAD